MSSYDEKFKALNVCSGLPVAVNSLDTLNRIGRFVQIGEYDAYRLTSFSNNPISSNEESVRSQNADLKRSEKQPILRADELHWRKLWGVTQKKLKSVE
jgi:hypothetical protein